MASFNIHLAVGKGYASKNKIKNLKLFYNGIIDPDLAEDKFKSHYTGVEKKENLLLYLKTKVQLLSFLQENNFNNDYAKGIFLHLITDYLFFNDFFDIDYLENITYKEFIKDLYYSYDCTNDYLKKKYDIDLSNFENKLLMNIKKNKNKKIINDKESKNLLEESKLDKFIERVSNISLEEYRDKLLKNNENILP